MWLNALSKLLSVLSVVLKLVPFCRSNSMRRVTTADKVSVGFHYFENEKEVGNVRYNLVEGYFVVFSWPPSFPALRKAREFVRLLSFAISIIKSEKV